MSSLSDFLLARIAEDEAEARQELADGYGDLYRSESGWSSGRVLAECDAKRRIVEEHPLVQSQTQADVIGCDTCGWDDFSWGREMVTNGPCVTLKALALPYADHPDYDEDWRP